MKPCLPALALVALVALVACSDGEDAELAATKYAATLCTKLDECNVPRDDPSETNESCRTRVEGSFKSRANGATKSSCSAEENTACRNAIAAQECGAFVTETILQSKLPAACEGC